MTGVISGGIIPARAGFTLDFKRYGEARSDHPRSRGVYTTFADQYGRPGGSSPLARGLPYQDRTDLEKARIIPARAGFTWPTSYWPR